MNYQRFTCAVPCGAGGNFRVFDDRYRPDVAFVGHPKHVSRQGFSPAPDLAIKVDYPSDAETQRRLRLKVSHYMAAGTVAWLVFPMTQRVEVHVPGQPVKLLTESGTLDGGALLPGFNVAVKDIFPPLPDEALSH